MRLRRSAAAALAVILAALIPLMTRLSWLVGPKVTAEFQQFIR
jgi:hypothetical protein